MVNDSLGGQKVCVEIPCTLGIFGELEMQVKMKSYLIVIVELYDSSYTMV